MLQYVERIDDDVEPQFCCVQAVLPELDTYTKTQIKVAR